MWKSVIWHFIVYMRFNIFDFMLCSWCVIPDVDARDAQGFNVKPPVSLSDDSVNQREADQVRQDQKRGVWGFVRQVSGSMWALGTEQSEQVHSPVWLSSCKHIKAARIVFVLQVLLRLVPQQYNRRSCKSILCASVFKCEACWVHQTWLTVQYWHFTSHFEELSGVPWCSMRCRRQLSDCSTQMREALMAR